jgi:hypothetical protein
VSGDYIQIFNVYATGLVSLSGANVSFTRSWADAGITASGAGVTVNYCVVKGAPFTVAAGGTVGLIQNVTVYGQDFVTTPDVTIKNSIADGINIVAGTVSGTTNLFVDAAKQGAGTYTDVGGTIWSGTPGFLSATDYHLTRASDAIGAGTDLSFDSDFEGRILRGLPEIGAYEFLALARRPLLGVGR